MAIEHAADRDTVFPKELGRQAIDLGRLGAHPPTVRADIEVLPVEHFGVFIDVDRCEMREPWLSDGVGGKLEVEQPARFRIDHGVSNAA
ncbi:hypothetical protein [Amorphus sp. 3PC139-8]|uniref:hypothetical protein n=1 Tax=Amorphus sp. 3PC139-8 TaxID=2735676 RepID=UPI00345D74A4